VGKTVLVSELIHTMAGQHQVVSLFCNVDERLDALRTEFYLQRQTAITTELLDIVSGFEGCRGRDA
jgi:F0F1-type ATP synthase gamma subunit